jgi:hypothetical protein
MPIPEKNKSLESWIWHAASFNRAAKVAPLCAQITANTDQSRTLATRRHTLRPKLLSGVLIIPAASAANEASV